MIEYSPSFWALKGLHLLSLGRAYLRHHDRDRDVGNYANLSPLMDILFGTYHCPDHEPERGSEDGGELFHRQQSDERQALCEGHEESLGN